MHNASFGLSLKGNAIDFILYDYGTVLTMRWKRLYRNLTRGSVGAKKYSFLFPEQFMELEHSYNVVECYKHKQGDKESYSNTV